MIATSTINHTLLCEQSVVGNLFKTILRMIGLCMTYNVHSKKYEKLHGSQARFLLVLRSGYFCSYVIFVAEKRTTAGQG